jgi:cobalt-zinc-cadmium efflux system protein
MEVFMSEQRRIFIAFILNTVFSIFEFIGGMLTGSVALMSDALHDAGDAISIGLSYFMERISTKKPNAVYTYGYRRYSILGGLITILILIVGSIFMFVNSIQRLLEPVTINGDGMMVLAIVGLIINVVGSVVVHGNSINQKAISLHLLEDVLGWAVVLIGAIVIKFTEWYWIDPVLSIMVSIIIVIHAIKALVEIINIFLIKTPSQVNPEIIRQSLVIVPGIYDVHSIRVWSIDGENHFATMHVVTTHHGKAIKRIIRETLKRHNIYNSTIEFETNNERCPEPDVIINTNCDCGHHY